MTKIRTTQKFATKKSTPQAKLETLRRKEARQHRYAVTPSPWTRVRFDYGKASR